MGKSIFAKIGDVNSSKEIKQKLKIDEYALEIGNEDIGRLKLHIILIR